MFRFLFQFIALLIFFAVARKVLTFLLTTVMGSFRATSDAAGSAARASRNDDLLASAGDLHQDPVCGTFVPGSSNWTRRVDGQTVYFCSAECRDRFLVSA